VIGWGQFLRIAVGGLAGLLAVAFGFIVLMNPYGHLPGRIFGAHVIMDINQRFQYPAIVRSGAFDSAVIGTSTSRLLDPGRLDAALGGRFANLAMNDARAWEQYRLALLFLQHQPGARTLLVGLDWVWCAGDADVDRITSRGFPEWLYDDNPWNDWLYLLNPRTVEFAGRVAAHRLGLRPPRIPANGFEVFVPPESAYDPAKVAKLIWEGRPKEIRPRNRAYVASAEDLRSWKFPALAWLEEVLAAAPGSTRRILVFMPVHVAQQPVPGSREAAREAACKARVAGIGRRHHATVLDFRIPSSLTTRDDNYWDPLHYRLPVAHRIVDDIARATTTRQPDPAAVWTILE
jgi:hypothetical protein